MDTGAFLALLSNNDSNALRPGGDAWKAALHVRFHKDSGSFGETKGERRWKTTELGASIRKTWQLHCWHLRPRTRWSSQIYNGTVPKSERRAYNYFWRYVGWLLGVETEDDAVADRASSTTLESQTRFSHWIPVTRLDTKQPDSIAYSEACLRLSSFILWVMKGKQLKLHTIYFVWVTETNH
jgi:hypothetical protein